MISEHLKGMIDASIELNLSIPVEAIEYNGIAATENYCLRSVIEMRRSILPGGKEVYFFSKDSMYE